MSSGVPSVKTVFSEKKETGGTVLPCAIEAAFLSDRLLSHTKS